jgi:hypothetical protein
MEGFKILNIKMLKIIDLLLIYFLLNNSIFAQKTLFLNRFEFQTFETQFFPNEFEGNKLGDSLKKKLENHFKKELGITEMASRKTPAIDYTPVITKDSPVLRSIKLTDFAYIAWVIGKIKTENNQKGLFVLEGEVFDKEDRRVWRNKIKINFTFSKENYEKNEPLVSKNDIEKLFVYGFQKLFKENVNTQIFAFQSVENVSLKKFIQNCDTFEIIKRNRGELIWSSKKNNHNITLKLNTPYEKDGMYIRTAQFENPFDKEKYQIQAYRANQRTYKRQVDFYIEKTAVTSLVIAENFAKNSWIGKLKEKYISLDYDKKTHKIQFFYQKELTAVLILKNKFDEKEMIYQGFFLKNTTEKEKAWLVNLLLTDELSHSVELFYQSQIGERK